MSANDVAGETPENPPWPTPGTMAPRSMAKEPKPWLTSPCRPSATLFAPVAQNCTTASHSQTRTVHKDAQMGNPTDRLTANRQALDWSRPRRDHNLRRRRLSPSSNSTGLVSRLATRKASLSKS